MAIRVKSRGGESVEQMLRRFKKLCEKEGLTKELKRRAHYEKPSERNRREARRFVPRPVNPGAELRALRSGVAAGPSSGPRAGARGGRRGPGGGSGGGSGGGGGGGGGGGRSSSR